MNFTKNKMRISIFMITSVNANAFIHQYINYFTPTSNRGLSKPRNIS